MHKKNVQNLETSILKEIKVKILSMCSKDKVISDSQYREILENYSLSEEQQEIIENWIIKKNIEVSLSDEELDVGRDDYLDDYYAKRKNAPVIDGFTKHLKEISKYPLLTREEEKQLGRRVRDNNDREAFDILMTSNLRLVISLAKKIKYRGNLTLPEIVQEGYVGLAEAIPNYDPERQTSFASYARWHIHHVMYRAVENTGRIIRVPVSAQTEMLKINRFKRTYQLENGCEPTEEEIIAAIPSVTAKKLHNLRPHFVRTSSLDIPTGDNDNSNIADFVVDEKNSNIEKITDRKILNEELNRLFDENLTKIEKKVLCEKYGINTTKKTIKKIAEDNGLKKDDVSMLTAQAIAKLKKNPKLHLLKAYLHNQ